MKKRTPILMMTILISTLLLLTAGCTSKTPSTVSASPSPSDAPSASVTPSSAVTPSTDPSPTPSLIVDPPPPSADTSVVPSVKPSADPEDDDDDAYSSHGWALMENDSIGAISYRLSESELISLLGEPESTAETVIWGADGLSHTDWNYPSKGLWINMAKQPDDVEASVFSIHAKAPCDLATQRGIKIGDSKTSVLKAYPNEYNTEDSRIFGNIVLGSIYGGIVFGIENDVVTSIFIGASAE